jgi:hypothetical protein
MDTSTFEFSIEPAYLTGHPRASKLKARMFLMNLVDIGPK